MFLRVKLNPRIQKSLNKRRLYFTYCNIEHRDLNGKYYINCRDTSAATSKPVYIHKYVKLSTVYTLIRNFRYSKSNNFYNMIAKINRMYSQTSCPKCYLDLNRWIGQAAEQFNVDRHGNVTKPHVRAFQEKPGSIKRSTGFTT